MKLVVAVDKEWGIGYKGDLLARVRADLRYFRSLTMDKTVVLGSTTLSTFPGGKPLKGRSNIVLSRRPDFAPEGALVVHSVDELLDAVKDHNKEDIVVIGGASVYRQLLPYCDTAYVTKFQKSFDKDAYFEDLDASDEWELISVGEPQQSDPGTDSEPGLMFNFCIYKRVAE